VQHWRIPLLISASFDSFKLYFISILLCVYVLVHPTYAFNNVLVSGIFLDFTISINSVFAYNQMLFLNL